jgi:hypothetical protein
MRTRQARFWKDSVSHTTTIATLGLLAWLSLTLLLVLPLGVQAGGVVTTCTEAALRAAVEGGGTVTFACDGTITLSNTLAISAETVLDGTGHVITLSGGDLVRVLSNAPGVRLTILSLGIANGLTTASGGGIYVAGELNATNCTFHDNSALGSSGATGYGGAIYNDGTIRIAQCSFVRNRAVGGDGNHGQDASPFIRAGTGGSGSGGFGGAIYNAGLTTIDRSLFATNFAAGGTGGSGGNGTMVVGFVSDQTGGRGGDGGYGQGGALFNVNTANVINCTFAGNLMRGGAGGQGGWGGLYTLNPHGNAVYFPGGGGGQGGPGGYAVCQSGGSLYLGNCTVDCNSSFGGIGGSGGSPGGQAGPSGETLPAGIGGKVSLINTLLAANSPGGNGSSGLIDLGHNLSSDATCTFTNAGSLNSVDPKLGSLANNGGPTLTMALLLGSPAIDAADPATAPALDQRGVPRPVGPAADIGAYEYGWPAALRINPSQDNGFDLLVSGIASQSCRLFASSNLSDWTPVATNQLGSDGTFLFHENCTPGEACRFYRLQMP